MSEQSLSEQAYAESLRESQLLRVAIVACREEVQANGTDAVSVVAGEMDDVAVIKVSSPEAAPSPVQGMLPVAVSGLCRRLGKMLRRGPEPDHVFIIDTAGQPDVPPYRITVGPANIQVLDRSSREDGETTEVTLTGERKNRALASTRTLLEGRVLAVKGAEEYDFVRQQRPSVEIEGIEAESLRDVADAIMCESPFGDPRVSGNIVDTTVRWIQETAMLPTGLEDLKAEKVWAWRSKEAPYRMGISVRFRYNPFGPGESLLAIIGARYRGGRGPDETKITYYETVPGTDRSENIYRFVPLDLAQRELVARAVRLQVTPGNVSVRRPYA